MVKCVSFILTSDTRLFVSLINFSVGCEIFECISLNAAACCGPVCLTFHGIAPHNCRFRPHSPSSHRRQEPVNREPPTSRRITKSIHRFRGFHRQRQRYVHGTRDFAESCCENSFCVLHFVSITLQKRGFGISAFQLCMIECCPLKPEHLSKPCFARCDWALCCFSFCCR